MWAGIAAARPYGRLGDVSCAIEQLRASRPRGATAGGTGRSPDTAGTASAPPCTWRRSCANQGKRGKGPRLLPGTALAIEPMVTLGRPATRELADGWTVVTRDGARAAHFEHSIGITEDGVTRADRQRRRRRRPRALGRRPGVAGLTPPALIRS